MSLLSRFLSGTTRTASRRASRSTATAGRGRNCRRLKLESLEERRVFALAVAVDYPAASNPQAVATADFNNDGKLDLAFATGPTGGRVTTRLGDGAGAFGTPREYVTGYPAITSIAAVDLNGDARLDIVLGLVDGFSILINNGDGAFHSPVTTEVPSSWGVSSVAAGDFSNDGNIDLVVAWHNADFMLEYYVFLGNGQGGFANMGNQGGMPGEGGGLATLDLNNDGNLDVAAADGGALLGYGEGHFYPSGPQGPAPGGRAVATGDFTGDGQPDLVVAGINLLAVLPARGDGYFYAPIHHTLDGAQSAVATGDFNADGKLDAAVTKGDSGTVSVMLGNGDGTLRNAGAFATGASPAAVTVGDFNGDGRPDVAVANYGSNTVSVLLNDGDWANPPPAPPTLSVSDATVTEGNVGTRTATFTLTLSHAALVDVSVNYRTMNITATELSDYTAASGALTIPAGQTSRTFTVAIQGDRVGESTETFSVNLSNPTNAPIADGQGIGTILDDEPQVAISDVTKSEGRNGQTTLFTFTVTLSAAYDQPVTMSFKTLNGTATTGNGDYNNKTGTLTFAPGQTTKTITIEVKGDRKREANEAFYVDLFGLSGNASFAKKRGIGTILNDD